MKILNGKQVFSVSEVNSLARQNLEGMSFWVQGEISSFRGINESYRYLYFDLKDPISQYKLPCIMDPAIYNSGSYIFEDGEGVLVLGNLTLWEKDARFQMYVHSVEPFGESFLLLELERLKKELFAKGYFDEAAKKPLPRFPQKIAVIGSSRSDAWHDFQKHSNLRFPLIDAELFDVLVQGDKSKEQVISAIKKADSEGFDLIAIIRGGGSLEDLETYNSREVAEAIYQAKTPIVVGVGHEKDVVVAQLVADVAASTPTDAAKTITENYLYSLERLEHLGFALKRLSRQKQAQSLQNLDVILQRISTHKNLTSSLSLKLNALETKVISVNKSIFDGQLNRLEQLHKDSRTRWIQLKLVSQTKLKDSFDKINLLSPQSVMARGYSIAYAGNGKPITDSSTVALGSNVRVKLLRGELKTKIISKQ